MCVGRMQYVLLETLLGQHWKNDALLHNPSCAKDVSLCGIADHLANPSVNNGFASATKFAP